MRGTKALLVVALVALGLAVQPVASAHAVDPNCVNQFSGVFIERLPWAVKQYDPANQLGPLSKGAGVTVAVLDTGVDATHFQLQGRVLPGRDFLGSTTGEVDCDGHGTAVASIIAAQRVDGFGFVGLAPNARILPVRLDGVDHRKPADSPGEELSPVLLAQAIDFAVSGGALVIAVPAVTYLDDPFLNDAVYRAVTAGVVIVAAVGDSQRENVSESIETTFPPYPAAYPGVFGVGAVGQNGVRAPSSQIGSYVDIVAPGVDVTAAALGGHDVFNDTGIAVGFVAAAVALMLGQPGTDLNALTGTERVDAITGRLRASADGRAGESASLGYGAGLVDPYRAMAETRAALPPQALPGGQVLPPDEAAIRLAAERADANAWALRSAAALVGLAILAVAAAYVMPRGRRRKWRPSRDRAAVDSAEDTRPEFLPGEALFRKRPQDVSAE